MPSDRADNPVRVGSLCTGYGGLETAVANVVGGELAWYAEIEPAAITVLKRHHPGVPNLGDLTAVEWMQMLEDGHVTGHGLTRSQELKLLGNGVVPPQAEHALCVLLPRLWDGQTAPTGPTEDGLSDRPADTMAGP